MSRLAADIAAAFRCHQAGQLAQAEQLCRQILQAEPRHADALHLLGLIMLGSRRSDLARDYMLAAVAAQPDFPEAHSNLGNIYQEQGQLDQAVACYRQALRINPRFAGVHNNLGAALERLGLLADAVASYQEALRLAPDYTEAGRNLARALRQLEQRAAAPQAVPSAMPADPQRAAALNTLGSVLFREGKFADSARHFGLAIQERSDFADAHANLGAALYGLGRLDEAVASLRQALKLRPGFVGALNNLGATLHGQGRLAEAVVCYREAVQLDPDHANAHFNLGISLEDLGEREAAAASYRRAIQLQPDYADAHRNLGLLLLLMGKFAEGWPEYEWRRLSPEFSAVKFPQPVWDGGDLTGRTIMLTIEQGWGDVLQFVRYAPLVKARGGRVAVNCPRALSLLLSLTPGIDWLPAATTSAGAGQAGSPRSPGASVAVDTRLIDFDVQASLLSLPGILGTTLANVPANVPYLFADPRRIEHWRGVLAHWPGFKIGVAWQGSRLYRRDAQRSIPLKHFAPLAKLPGVQLISLQKGDGSEQIVPLAAEMSVAELGPDLDRDGAFVDTAAVMKNLDLIITSDTAIAHLAGGLGVPVWVALPMLPDWRWLLDREDSPWYPAMRLFRQTQADDWSTVFERLADALRLQLAAPRSQLPVAVILERARQRHEAGDIGAAEQLYLQTLAADPQQVDALHMLGLIAFQAGRSDQAREYIARAVRLQPDFAEAHGNLALVLQHQGHAAEAAAAWREALRHKPNYVRGHIGLGVVLHEQGRLEEAVACCREALRLAPDAWEAHVNLGLALRELGRLDQAIASLELARKLKPDHANIHNSLGNVLRDEGRLDEAVTSYREALRRQPNFAMAHSNLLYALQYRPGVTLAELAAAHREFDRQHVAPLRNDWRPHVNSRDPDRVLRVGFVSADFAGHPVGYFLIRALEHLDRSQVEIVCYSTRHVADEMTRRFQAVATVWRDVARLSDVQLADQVRADGIDVLVDLAGHTSGNRLLVFARKPAPLQVSWIGYEGTTGLEALDFILADRWMVPAGVEPHYAEQVLRMPQGYVCYDPSQSAPPVNPLPARTKGYTTFCSLNNPAKLNPQVVAAWAAILRSVPDSRLLLQYRGLDDLAVRNRFLAQFAAQGVQAGRLDIRGPTSYAAYLAVYAEADIALDPFPFAGGVTTCEALWMGVPVITWPGETFAGRHTLSHLSNIDLTATIARDLADYVAIARDLAGDLDRLAALRAGLRPRMAASALCDGRRFAADWLHVVRAAWRQFCAAGERVE